MSTVEKTYTVEQTATIVNGYTEGQSVEALALEVGKSVRSVIAKLSREGVYKAKAKALAQNKLTKAQMVSSIAVGLGVSEELVESLEKANHEALELVAKALGSKQVAEDFEVTAT